MKLNRAVARDGGELLRSELQHVGHDAKIDVEPAQGMQGIGVLEGGELEQGNSSLLCRNPQRIGRGIGLFGCAKYARHGIAALEEGLEHRFAEFLLPYDGNSHNSNPLDSLTGRTYDILVYHRTRVSGYN